MAATPRFKVFDSKGVYQASCKEIEAAAVVVGFYGDGARIKDKETGVLVWAEGSENMPASESFDNVAHHAAARIQQAHAKSYARTVLARIDRRAKVAA